MGNNTATHCSGLVDNVVLTFVVGAWAVYFIVSDQAQRKQELLTKCVSSLLLSRMICFVLLLFSRKGHFWPEKTITGLIYAWLRYNFPAQSPAVQGAVAAFEGSQLGLPKGGFDGSRGHKGHVLICAQGYPG